MFDLLTRMFNREASKDLAKERLRLVLVHDRADISPQVMEALKGDLIRVISGYLDVDESGIEVDLTRDQRSVALVASIPVRSVRRGEGS